MHNTILLGKVEKGNDELNNYWSSDMPQDAIIFIGAKLGFIFSSFVHRESDFQMRSPWRMAFILLLQYTLSQILRNLINNFKN